MECAFNKEAVSYTLSVVSGKWKWIILGILYQYRIQRYGEIKKIIPDITHKMLSQQLKELEGEKLVLRKSYNQIPPKVEYSLTEKGETLIPIIKLMSEWGA